MLFRSVSQSRYTGLDGETIVIYDGEKEVGKVPLHNLEGIVSFGYRGTSPALMGACADRNISLCYLTPPALQITSGTTVMLRLTNTSSASG